MKLKMLTTRSEANKVIAFLTSPKTLDQTWAPGEKNRVKKAVLSSLRQKNHVYWYIDQSQVIGAIGIRENDLESGGYVMIDDYFAVAPRYRRHGLGTQLLAKVEQYVKKQKGRYILVETCDIESYRPARTFYEKQGYKKTGYTPDYFMEGEGKIEYFKKFSHS